MSDNTDAAHDPSAPDDRGTSPFECYGVDTSLIIPLPRSGRGRVPLRSNGEVRVRETEKACR